MFRTGILLALAACFTLVFQTDVFAAGWSIESADTGIRSKLVTIVFLLTAFMAIRAYAKGKKGAMVVELLAGAFLIIFIASSDPSKSVMEVIKQAIGLGG